MLTDFKGQDPSLSGSIESLFLEDAVEAFKKNDKGLFEKAYSNFSDRNSGTFDEWKKIILNRLYQKIGNDSNNNIENKPQEENNLEEENYLG